MLEIRHLQMLSTLKRHGSLATTAEELNLTASAISHQLKELESYYDITLVNRRTRPVSFTPAGLLVLELADSILPQVARTKSDIRRLAHGQSGRLRLASECHSCFDWLMPILNAYRKQYADVELDFATGFEPEPHQMLMDGEIDLLITASDLPIDGVHYQPLFTYESRLVLSPAHRLARHERISPDDLSNQTLIAYPVESARLDVIAKFLAPVGINPAHIRTTELTAMLIQLVASERGVAALPDWVVAEYERKGWVVSRPLGAGVYCQLYAAVRTADRGLDFMKGFLGLLDEIKKP
ncbi:LysR family transcriptional regulator [Moraxella sp. FZLJ2107]|uniref:LysR family transcriptional regulator n=1 Tax=unclassified Moraxella TaxID=2685852 RepID=UPI00209C22B0|nr:MULTISPECIES: LysR family transcriptional regulator [unclassified Moraxella]USZ15888.1 LysR family transcriptional regulator [Moraxella sp. FZFQ2102]UTO06213.1 LysR family transcriptional regulator [Moraxella sp. FZLJ2107]UTO23489.1 LysR family transcriptional regulator [Moraxella sp. FZLJ2109]